MDSHTKHIKRALVITTQDLKERSQHQREQWDFTVPVKDTPMESSRYLRGLYSKQNKNKLRDNPKHLAHYILLQIAYIDNYYKMH